jgi:hypothetical protein
VIKGQADAGEDALRISSRVGDRLRPGDHEAVVTATDAVGNESAASTRGFEVVK